MDINFLALKPGVGYLNLLPHLLHGLWNIAQRKFVDDAFEHPTEEIRGLNLRLGREHPVYDAVGRNLMIKAPAYAWYVRIPDETTFLKAIKPQLEANLAESNIAIGFSGEIKLNFYQSGVHLKFKEGALEIEPWQPSDGSSGDAHFPGNTFWSVICGMKKASELAEEIPDCWMSHTARGLLDCIFPTFNGQVWVMGGGG